MSASSLRTLASTLDDLVVVGALVSESPGALTVSQLSAEQVKVVAESMEAVSWSFATFDRANTETDLHDLHDSFGPFRLAVKKPKRDDGANLVVTAAGFADLLQSEQETGMVAVVGLGHPIVVEGMQYVPEDAVAVDPGQPRTFRSPRTLVREYGASRLVPLTIGRWLLIDPLTWYDTDERFKLWVSHAVRAILLALPTEIDQNTRSYVFRGPPRLALQPLDAGEDIVNAIKDVGFQDLQAAATWIYELDREAENRHTLFATEFARTGSLGTGTLDCVRENIGHALEGAKIAHAMSVAKVSADNLKALADLRKAVTDETGKIADAARQVVGALASAMAVGIGLIAARVAANAPGPLVLAVMGVVAAYIFVVIYSGHRFAALQRGLRDMWRNQIYRFLSPGEYEQLVIQPSLDAEKIFSRVSWAGGIAVAVTFAVAAWVALAPTAGLVASIEVHEEPGTVTSDAAGETPEAVPQAQSDEPSPERIQSTVPAPPISEETPSDTPRQQAE